MSKLETSVRSARLRRCCSKSPKRSDIPRHRCRGLPKSQICSSLAADDLTEMFSPSFTRQNISGSCRDPAMRCTATVIDTC